MSTRARWSSNSRRLCVAAGVLAGCLAASQASPPSRLRAEQIAYGRALQALRERIQRLPGPGDMTIGERLAQSPNLRRAVVLALRERPRRGLTRFYASGDVEVDVAVQPTELVDILIAADRETNAPSDAVFTRAALQPFAARWPVVWVTGTATPTDAALPTPQPGWEGVAPEAIEIARRAAIDDAFDSLLSVIAQQRLSAARRVSDFFDASDAARVKFAALLRENADATVTLAPDRLAIATATIPTSDLIAMLSELRRVHAQNHDFEQRDFAPLSSPATPNMLSALGFAAPETSPSRVSDSELLDLDEPDWTRLTLRAAGDWIAAPDRPALTREAAIEAARLAAIGMLREQVCTLPVRGPVRVEAMLAQERTLKPEVARFLTGARTTRVEPRDGGVRVWVELPAARLWSILKTAMPPVRVSPPDPMTE